MSYVKKILFDGEEILYQGRVHWIVYAKGIFSLLAAMFCALILPDFGGEWTAKIAKEYKIFQALPGLIVGGLFIHGSYNLISAFLKATFTELVVTSHRIVAKFGVYETTTMEMDRHKIAGITIHQSITGKMLGYGDVFLRGFGNNISDLPPLVDPYELQKYTSTGSFL